MKKDIVKKGVLAPLSFECPWPEDVFVPPTAEELRADNTRLQGDVEYLSDPHNLEKELRARFNYRSPNEKLIIVVPQEGEETE